MAKRKVIHDKVSGNHKEEYQKGSTFKISRKRTAVVLYSSYDHKHDQTEVRMVLQ